LPVSPVLSLFPFNLLLKRHRLQAEYEKLYE
jgi:hypothetical protein